MIDDPLQRRLEAANDLVVTADMLLVKWESMQKSYNELRACIEAYWKTIGEDK